MGRNSGLYVEEKFSKCNDCRRIWLLCNVHILKLELKIILLEERLVKIGSTTLLDTLNALLMLESQPD